MVNTTLGSRPAALSAVTLQRRAGRAPVVWVSGEVDAVAVPGLRDRLQPIIAVDDGYGNGSVVLDLSRVTFLDVSGMRLLLETRRALAGAARRLVLRDPSPCVDLVLGVCGCDPLLSDVVLSDVALSDVALSDVVRPAEHSREQTARDPSRALIASG